MGLSIPGFDLQGDASGIAPQYAAQLPSAESHLAARTGEVDHGRQTWRTICWGPRNWNNSRVTMKACWPLLRPCFAAFRFDF